MSHSYLYQSYQTVPWYLSQSFSQTPLSSSLPQLSSSSSPRKCPSDFMISNKVICICQPWILSSQSSYHHWSRYHWISSQCCSPRDHQWWISRKERPCCLKWLQQMFTEIISPPTSDKVRLLLLSVSMAWKISRNSWESEMRNLLIRSCVTLSERSSMLFKWNIVFSVGWKYSQFSWEVLVRPDWLGVRS